MPDNPVKATLRAWQFTTMRLTNGNPVLVVVGVDEDGTEVRTNMIHKITYDGAWILVHTQNDQYKLNVAFNYTPRLT
jgi:hypothetical protein